MKTYTPEDFGPFGDVMTPREGRARSRKYIAVAAITIAVWGVLPIWLPV